MRSKQFWQDTAERAIKTFAQTLLATLSMAVVGTAVWELEWTYAVGASLTATLFSLLTSVVSAGANDPESASLITQARHSKE